MTSNASRLSLTRALRVSLNWSTCALKSDESFPAEVLVTATTWSHWRGSKCIKYVVASCAYSFCYNMSTAVWQLRLCWHVFKCRYNHSTQWIRTSRQINDQGKLAKRNGKYKQLHQRDMELPRSKSYLALLPDLYQNQSFLDTFSVFRARASAFFARTSCVLFATIA